MRPTTQLLLAFVSASLLFSTSCSSGPSEQISQEAVVNQRPSIADIIERRGEEFLAMDGVVVIFEGATGAGDPCIKIGVAELNSALKASLPTVIEGWPVVIFESGVIEPMSDP